MKQKLPNENKRGSCRRSTLLLLALLGIIPLEGFTSNRSFSSPEFASPLSGYSRQNRPISGIVRDNTGIPLPGVSVLLKGTGIGTVTDAEGRFTINTSGAEQPTLIFKFIGFKAKEVQVTGQTSLELSLEEDTKMMDEVVVVGYGTQKKANLTGAVSQVDSKVLEDRPITNINSGLQGMMSGVTVTGALGAPGSNAGTIRIRGIGTIGDAQPLVVIDGIPGGNLNILNPSDIETISVLKDAASSSIYGVRGANGVILVTTKKGNKGKPSVAYNNYFGLQTPTALPDFVSSPEYMELLNEAERNVGRNPTYSQEEIEIARNGSDPNYFANTDWVNEIYKDNAPQQNHNVSINGGADNLNYYLSYGYLKEGGLVKGDNFKAHRHNIRAKLSTTIADRLQVNTNLGYIDRNVLGAAAGTDPLYMAHTIIPLVPVRTTAGGWGYIGGSSNPVAVATDGGTNDFGSQELTANLDASLELFKGFRVRGQYGMVRYNSKRTIFTKTINYYSPEDGSIIYQTGNPNKIDTRDYTGLYQSLTAMAEYERRFDNKHEVKLLVAASQEDDVSDNFTASRTNLPTQSAGHLALGTENQLNSGTYSEWALQSVFGRVNYGFKDKYLVEANLRYDGSSKFASDLRWDLFASASLGWVFTEESFLDGIKDVVDFGKIRASYGTQGNDRVDSYAYINTLGPVATMPIGNQLTVGYRHSGVPNAFLRWETQLKQNVGLDLVFLRNRLGLTADYFVNETKDILLVLPLPDVLGTDYPKQNAGVVQNKGWELQLSWQDDIGDFSYGASFNLSDVRNKVKDLAGFDPVLEDRMTIEGQPINAFYGLVADRIAQESDFRYDPETSSFVPDFPYLANDPVRPGDLIYKDLNKDGKITLDEDRQVIGSHIPRYTYGFSGNMGWKGIDLNFTLQGVGKVNGYIYGSARHAFIDQSTMPQKVHLDRWTPENTDASYPRLTYQQSHNQRLSTYWLEDASYLRLKNVQIGYTLPTQLTERLRVSRLRVYASAENLFTKTDFFYGYDPESPVTNGNFYPQVKTYVFGVNINFK